LYSLYNIVYSFRRSRCYNAFSTGATTPNCLFLWGIRAPGLIRLFIPNCMLIGSAVFVQLIRESRCTMQWGGTCPLLPQTRVFHVEVTDSCTPFILFAPSILWSVLRCVYVGPLVVCLFLCTYLFAVLWRITAAAARHAGRVNFGPTAMRSNVVVTICTRLLRRGAIYEHCRDRLQLPVERCR